MNFSPKRITKKNLKKLLNERAIQKKHKLVIIPPAGERFNQEKDKAIKDFMENKNVKYQ